MWKHLWFRQLLVLQFCSTELWVFQQHPWPRSLLPNQGGTSLSLRTLKVLERFNILLWRATLGLFFNLEDIETGGNKNKQDLKLKRIYQSPSLTRRHMDMERILTLQFSVIKKTGKVREAVLAAAETTVTQPIISTYSAARLLLLLSNGSRPVYVFPC